MAERTQSKSGVQMHIWAKIESGVPPLFKDSPRGMRCIKCGSTVGTGTGMDSASFPCPGRRLS